MSRALLLPAKDGAKFGQTGALVLNDLEVLLWVCNSSTHWRSRRSRTGLGVFKLADGLLLSQARKQTDDHLQGLKRLLEAEP